jgi:PAS domain S-box-containing protein
MIPSLSVLIIEESEEEARLIVRSLRQGRLGLFTWDRVDTAATLHQALNRQGWDVVISTDQLSGVSAATAIAIVQQHPSTIPLIVVSSGTIGETAAIELRAAGVYDYLGPEALVRLPEVVRQAVKAVHWRHQYQHAERALDVAKEHLQLALDGSGIALWDWFLPDDAITVNELWATMLGYGLPDLTPLDLAGWKHYVHPADLTQVEQALNQHLSQATPKYQCELRLRHRSGAWIWVLDQGHVVEQDQDGRPLRMTGTTLNISDRKRTELRLALQSAILERIAKAEPLQDILEALVQATEAQLDESLCSILLCGNDEKLYPIAAPSLPQTYNQALKGTAIGEAMGSCGTAAQRRQLVIVEDIATDPLWQDFRDLALAHGLRACWSIPVFPQQGAVLATFAVYYRQARRPYAHELETIQLVANLIQIAIERDRTHRALEQLNHDLETRVHQRTVALHHSEAKLHEAQQIARLGSWEMDVPSQTITWSPEVCHILRHPVDQPTSRLETALGYLSAPDQQRCQALINRAIQVGEPFTVDLPVNRADGSIGYIFIKAEAISDATGQVTRLFGIVMDISDRRRAEEQLRQMNQELLQATRLKDEFLANMSHELRTPLNAILGMAEGLQERIFGEINDQQVKALETIQNSGDHLLALINDILDLAKIESGQIKLDHRSVSVAALCQSSLAFVEPQALKKRIHLDLQLPPHPISLWGDERRLRQVLINLLNNAVKFTPEEGQVTLTSQIIGTSGASPVDSRVVPPVAIKPPYLRMAVSDTGIGIDPAHLDQLFQPFVQIDSALNRQFQGTGLGLALVKQIVALHGGHVDVSSQVGEGSSFAVDLPLPPTIDSPGQALNSVPIPLLSTPETSILLAAGHTAYTNTLISYLRAKGYTLVAAEEGEAAIALARAQPFSLIVLDLDIPTRGSLDIIAQLATVTHQRQVPIIALGASTSLAEPAPSEAIVYIPKPVQLKLLMTKMQHLLSCPRNTR